MIHDAFRNAFVNTVQRLQLLPICSVDIHLSTARLLLFSFVSVAALFSAFCRDSISDVIETFIGNGLDICECRERLKFTLLDERFRLGLREDRLLFFHPNSCELSCIRRVYIDARFPVRIGVRVY